MIGNVSNCSVVGVCGEGAGRYRLGSCALRWTALLATLACCDAFLLGGLALTLANRQVNYMTQLNEPDCGETV